jgi:hypothetical protein
MHLLYNGQTMASKAITSSISGTKLTSDKWFLTYIKRDRYSLDTRVVSSNFNSTMTYEVLAKGEWDGATVMIGTNGDVQTWDGELFNGVASEDFDLFGLAEEKFHFNKNYNPVDDVLRAPNLAKDFNPKVGVYATVLVKDNETNQFAEIFGSSKEKIFSNFGENETIFDDQFRAQAYLLATGITTSRKPAMGFRMLVSGSVRLINRSNQWQFDNQYFQEHKSIFPIYRLLTEDGTP